MQYLFVNHEKYLRWLSILSYNLFTVFANIMFSQLPRSNYSQLIFDYACEIEEYSVQPIFTLITSGSR